MSRMDRIWVQRSKVNVLSKGQRILVHVKIRFKKKASLTRHYIIIWRIILNCRGLDTSVLHSKSEHNFC